MISDVVLGLRMPFCGQGQDPVRKGYLLLWWQPWSWSGWPLVGQREVSRDQKPWLVGLYDGSQYLNKQVEWNVTWFLWNFELFVEYWLDSRHAYSVCVHEAMNTMHLCPKFPDCITTPVLWIFSAFVGGVPWGQPEQQQSVRGCCYRHHLRHWWFEGQQWKKIHKLSRNFLRKWHWI